MDQRLISNQVFREIQSPTEKVRLEPGTILYANEYSGREKVDMPAWLKNIFNGDLGSVGNNVLVQLNKKIQAMPNGPWYLDTRDDIIYIHNQRFKDPPVYSYIYQREYGELLSVSFETQYITKNRHGLSEEGLDSEKMWNFNNTASGDDPNRKLYTDYEADDKETLRQNAIKAFNDYIGGKLSWEQFDLFNKKLKKSGITWKDSDKKKIQAKYREDNFEAASKARRDLFEDYQKYLAAGGEAPVKEGRFVQQGRYGMTTQQIWQNIKDAPLYLLGVHTDRILIDYSGDSQELMNKYQREINQHMRKGDLEDYLKAHFNKAHYFDDPKDPMTPFTYETLELDPRDYCPQTTKAEIDILAKDKSKEEVVDRYYVDTRIAKEGLAALTMRSDLVVISTTGMEPPKDWVSLKEVDYEPEKYVYNPRVKVFRKKVYGNKFRIGVPQWKVMMAYYSRRGANNDDLSPLEIQQRIWEALNDQTKTKIKKLVCRMTCVGNPLLTSSKIISLKNVGRRWSGNWRILNVTHQLTPGEGYTCQLELTQNNHTGDDVNMSAQLSMNKGATDSSTAFNFTTNEAMYYNYLLSNKDWATEADEFMIKVLKSRDVDSEYYSKYGIVQKVTDTSTAHNKRLKAEATVVDDPRLSLNTEDKKKYGSRAIKARERVEKLKKQ